MTIRYIVLKHLQNHTSLETAVNAGLSYYDIAKEYSLLLEEKMIKQGDDEYFLTRKGHSYLRSIEKKEFYIRPLSYYKMEKLRKDDIFLPVK